jgi:hypothetical protein
LLFEDFVQRPENQVSVLEFGFRPGNIEVPIGEPIVAENGVDPTSRRPLAVPDPEVMVEPARPLGGAAQGRAGPAGDGRVRVDG